MSLEDYCEDIIGKAQKGLKISDTELCSKAGIDEQSLRRAKSTRLVDPEIIREIALALELAPDALVVSAKKAWKPKKIEIEGLRQYESKYGFKYAYGFNLGLVNSYLIWDPKTHEGVIADTGMDSTEMIAAIDKLKIKPKMLLLTHSHSDHIAELDKISKAFPNLKIVIHKKELVPGAQGIEAGITFNVGRLNITTRKTSGHSPGGLTYLIEGLEKPIAIVGDSLFAGSMGGAALAYKEALTNNRQQILSLSDETIICPGHGPMTTVREEKDHNPFFPEFKR